MLGKFIITLITLAGSVGIGCTVFAQDFYNYPVPVGDSTAINSSGSNNTNPVAAAGLKNENSQQGTSQRGATTETYDKNTGLTDSNTRYGRIIHDQLDVNKNEDDMYNTWQKMALLGKDQFEIEEFYREIPQSAVEKVKDRLRQRILYNLERRRLAVYTTQTEDIQDLKLAVNIVNEEVRRYSLEADTILKTLIQDQYGIKAFIFEELNYVVQ